MTGDYISCKDTIAAFEELSTCAQDKPTGQKLFSLGEIICILRAMPLVGDQAVRMGDWEERILEDEDPLWRRRFYCTACGDWTTYGKSDFCPNCGADMRLSKEDNTDYKEGRAESESHPEP